MHESDIRLLIRSQRCWQVKHKPIQYDDGSPSIHFRCMSHAGTCNPLCHYHVGLWRLYLACGQGWIRTSSKTIGMPQCHLQANPHALHSQHHGALTTHRYQTDTVRHCPQLPDESGHHSLLRMRSRPDWNGLRWSPSLNQHWQFQRFDDFPGWQRLPSHSMSQHIAWCVMHYQQMYRLSRYRLRTSHSIPSTIWRVVVNCQADDNSHMHGIHFHSRGWLDLAIGDPLSTL